MLQQPAANPSILQFPETLFQSSKVCDCDVAWSPHKAPLAWWHRDVMVGRGSSAHLSAGLQLNQVSLSSRVQAVEMNKRFQRLTDYHRVQLDHQGASPLHTPFSCCFSVFSGHVTPISKNISFDCIDSPVKCNGHPSRRKQ